MFILASLTLPFVAFTAFSRTGVSCLQGPHQGAQKSTSTGWSLDSSITSFMKPCVVVSLTTSAAVIAPPSCNICRLPYPPRTARKPGFRAALDGLSGKGTQSSRHVRGTARKALDSRDMADGFEEFYQI